MEEKILWQGKPESLIDKAKGKLNSVEYIITNERIRIKHGLIGKKEDEIDLVRINDIRVDQGIKDRVQGIGKIIVTTTDTLNPAFIIQSIKNPHEVKELLRKAIREEKERQNVRYHEGL